MVNWVDITDHNKSSANNRDFTILGTRYKKTCLLPWSLYQGAPWYNSPRSFLSPLWLTEEWWEDPREYQMPWLSSCHGDVYQV